MAFSNRLDYGTLDSMNPLFHLAYPWFLKTIVRVSKEQLGGLCFLPYMSMTYSWLETS